MMPNKIKINTPPTYTNKCATANTSAKAKTYNPAKPSIVKNIAKAAYNKFFVHNMDSALPHVKKANTKKARTKGLIRRLVLALV